ncbi:hypothetical protein ES703_91985 [subsurface metagenome]
MFQSRLTLLMAWLVRVPIPDAALAGEFRITGEVKLSLKVISLILVVSTDHNRFWHRHRPYRVALSLRPRVTVSKLGPSEKVGLKQRSMPPSALLLAAYRVPSVVTITWLSMPPLGRVLSMLSQSVLVPIIKRWMPWSALSLAA